MTQIYDAQRRMRALRRAAMQRGVVAVLDIGSFKTACLVLRFDGPERGGSGEGAMAGQSDFRVIGAATTRSRGMRGGEIDAAVETERAIRTVVQAAQKMAGVRVDHAIACVSGGRPRSYGLTGRVQIPHEVVRDGDIARVLAACDLPDIGPERDVLHAQPVNFALDGRSGLGDPRDQIGRKLACDLHLLTVDRETVRRLVGCVTRCDLELAGIASSAYAAGLAALTEDEQELGAACVDLGGGATGLSIFLKRHMIYADAVRLGGEHVTADIAAGLRVPQATAERMKTFHGGIFAGGADDRERIATGGTTGDWELDARTVTRAELIGVMRPRVEEVLEDVRASLDAAGFDSLPSQTVVLTGGGADIPGLDTLAPRILGRPVRIGRPLRVRGLPEQAAGPAFAATVGLCLFATHPQDECWDFEMPPDRYSSHSVRRAVRWFRDNW
jgi:cell division protein FtsA